MYLKSDFRKFWKTHGWVRIGVFWFGSAISTAVVIMVITTDWITWDRINRDFISTSGKLFSRKNSKHPYIFSVVVHIIKQFQNFHELFYVPLFW